MSKKLNDLPESENEVWEGGEKYLNHPTNIQICSTHGRDNWMDHKGYIDNRDGTFSCKWCPWGARLPGYLRIHEERIVDLRSVAGK